MALNVAECITLPAQQSPEAVALVFESIRLTFGSLLEQVQRVAAFLERSGLQPGDRVALLLPNTPHFPIIYYGVLYAGGIAVPLNPMQTAGELNYLLQDATPQLVFVWSDLADVVTRATEGLTSIPDLVVVETDLVTVVPESGYSFLTEMARADTKPAMAETTPDDVAVIMYTAAYNGRPLGAQLTHYNIFQNAYTAGHRLLKFTPEDCSLGVLPLFHSFGQIVLMNAVLLAGSSLVLMARFDATRVFELIEKERVTVIGLVPTMYHFLLGTKTNLQPDLSSLRHVLAGGAMLSQDLVVAFRERFGHTILEGYGLTETSPVVSFNMSMEANRPGSMGLPLWGCNVRAVDEAGNTLPPGETGELLVRGHNVMKGYLNQPEVTEKAIVDGWFHTGDRGYLDKDGYLYFQGLKKDMFIRAGLNVYPREIERVLEEHPQVAEAAVIGVADVVRGAEGQAFVVLSSELDDAEKELKRYCRELMAGYKCPRAIVFLASLPRRNDGRIDKDALRER